MKIKALDSGRLVCSWYAGCERLAAGAVSHPIGYIPTCKECADKHDLALLECDLFLEFVEV